MIYVGLLIAIAVVVYLTRKKPAEQPKQDNPKLDESMVTASPTIKDGEKVIVVKDGVKTEGTVKIMAQGFQAFDADGNIVVNVTTQMAKYIGVFETGRAHGEIIDNRLQGMDIWLLIVDLTLSKDSVLVKRPDYTGAYTYKRTDEPYFDFNSDSGKLSWHYNYEAAQKNPLTQDSHVRYYPISQRIMYGVY